MSVLKVAAAQMPCATGLTDDNIARHLGMIDDARAKGADVLVFPELSLTGYAGTPDLSRWRGRRVPQSLRSWRRLRAR
jgi:predicted amidohydrolase